LTNKTAKKGVLTELIMEKDATKANSQHASTSYPAGIAYIQRFPKDATAVSTCTPHPSKNWLTPIGLSLRLTPK